MNTKLIQVLQTIIELSPESLEKIASKFSVTERTLRYQIDKINEFFEDSDVEANLIIKKGVVNISEKNMIKDFLKSLDVDISKKDRKELLGLMILIGRDCNLTNLAKKLELTRNSLKNTLVDIKKEFNKFDLNLEFFFDKGYVLSGDEESIRRAQYEMISKAFFKENGVLEIDNYNLFSDYFNEELRIETKKFLKNLQKEMGVTLNDNNYKIMYLYIMIVIKRIEDSKNFLKKIGNEIFLKNTFEFKVFQEKFGEFQKKVKINIPYFDKLKIFEIILGCTAILEKQDYFEDWITLELKVKKIIKLIGKELKVDFFKDKYLYGDLINHIRPMLYRLKNGFSIKNSEIEEFKVQNYIFFKSIEKVVVREFSLDKDNVQDECIFIAIHFKVAKDRIEQLYKSRKNVLIVCNFGYGTGKLIGNQIIEKFDANIMGIISFKELENMNIDNIDYIITTLNKEPFEFISFPKERVIKV
ncbi:MAG: BglG family transcription antiterminator, partial [Cetobacterium sp.]